MAKVKHRVGINGPIEKVFAALTTNEGFAGWWATSAEINAKIGGKITLAFDNLTVLRFEYKNIQENKKVEIKCTDGPGPWQDSVL